jgi:hypothetical protein
MSFSQRPGVTANLGDGRPSHLFISVKNLHLIKEFASRITPTLQVLVEEKVSKALPALKNIFLAELRPSGPVQQAIGFARQLAGHTIAVSQWVLGRTRTRKSSYQVLMDAPRSILCHINVSGVNLPPLVLHDTRCLI